MTWQILLFQNYVVIVMGTFLEFFRNYPSVHFSSHFFQIPVTGTKETQQGLGFSSVVEVFILIP